PWGDAREPARPVEPPWPGQVPPPSPATVHRPPLPADVADEHGAPITVTARGLASGAPARLALNGRWSTVAGWARPWTVDERWGAPGARCRRARWQITTEDGTAHLLSLAAGKWAVEATYD